MTIKKRFKKKRSKNTGNQKTGNPDMHAVLGITNFSDTEYSKLFTTIMNNPALDNETRFTYLAMLSRCFKEKKTALTVTEIAEAVNELSETLNQVQTFCDRDDIAACDPGKVEQIGRIMDRLKF